MDALRPNYICRPYRGVSVQALDVALEETELRAFLLGRRVYRRTEFLVAERDGAYALAGVEKADHGDDLFWPVTAVHWIAGPADVAFVRDPEIDTGNATQLARAARSAGRDAHVYVVEGRNQHVNFIVEPRPVRVRVVEVVPPHPPKLLDMAQRVLEYDEDLDPVDLELVALELHELARDVDAERWLLPCRCAGIDLGAPVDFLDSGPPQPAGWTLLGCERSRQIHAELYGVQPHARVEMCPRRLDLEADRPTLLKCCLRERGIEHDAITTIVPWGATLEEVREALHLIVARAARAVVVS